MKLTLSTNQIIDLFKALTDLRGAPTVIEGENGKPQVVHTAYPLSEKAKWNAAKNRSILKRLVIAHDEIMQDSQNELNVFRKAQRDSVKDEADATIKAQKIAASRQLVQDRVDEMNAQMTVIGRQEQEVDNLLPIPAKGLCLKTSMIPPTVVGDLMPLLDGEPEFDETPPKK